jgi:Family of unknown function (DUF5989)
MSSPSDPRTPPPDDFEREAQGAERGFISELFAFLRENRKWWLLPAIIVLLLVGVLGVLGGTALAPFIYTLF